MKSMKRACVFSVALYACETWTLRKLSLFGHICRMENERKMKSVILGSMDGKGKRGRPKREWLDDIREWCQKDNTV